MTQQVLHSRGFRFSGLIVILVTTAFTLPARSDHPHPKQKDQYKRQVEKLEEVWRTAQLNGDADAMDRLLSDDYIGITMTGQVVTKMQQLDRMRKRGLILTKMEFQDVKVKLIGTTAVVTSLAEVDGTNDTEPMHGTFRATRVYSRSVNGLWKITNYEATRVGPLPNDHRSSRLNPTEALKPE